MLILASVLLVVFFVMALTLISNRAHLFSDPGFFTRLNLFLTTHRAEIREGSDFPELKPPRFNVSTDELFEQVLIAIKQPGWTVLSTQPNDKSVHVVVETPLWRFKDDVHIWVVDVDGISSIHAVSQSRVGKGDLAANSRHLQELVERLKSQLE